MNIPGLSGDSQSIQHSGRSPPLPPPPSYSPDGRGTGHGRWRSASQSQTVSPQLSTYSDSVMMMDANRPGGGEIHSDLDLVQQHYCTAYRMEELKTFHCERVRKMPLSGLDPSMLIGFLCRDESDWWDFRRRVGEVSAYFVFCLHLD
jgi:cysteine protease ATG4